MTDDKELTDEQIEAITRHVGDLVANAEALLRLGEEVRRQRTGEPRPLATSPTQRAALVTWLLAEGVELTTNDVADLCQFSQRAAQDLMQQLSEVLPIERERRFWRAKSEE